MLGNIANASIIGSIGLVIPFNDEKLSLCKRIGKYVTFATNVELFSSPLIVAITVPGLTNSPGLTSIFCTVPLNGDEGNIKLSLILASAN